MVHMGCDAEPTVHRAMTKSLWYTWVVTQSLRYIGAMTKSLWYTWGCDAEPTVHRGYDKQLMVHMGCDAEPTVHRGYDKELMVHTGYDAEIMVQRSYDVELIVHTLWYIRAHSTQRHIEPMVHSVYDTLVYGAHSLWYISLTVHTAYEV